MEGPNRFSSELWQKFFIKFYWKVMCINFLFPLCTCFSNMSTWWVSVLPCVSIIKANKCSSANEWRSSVVNQPHKQVIRCSCNATTTLSVLECVCVCMCVHMYACACACMYVCIYVNSFPSPFKQYIFRMHSLLILVDYLNVAHLMSSF